jgi:hypothetical protein
MPEDDTKDWPTAMFHGQENPSQYIQRFTEWLLSGPQRPASSASLMQWRDGGPVWGSVSLPDGDGQRAGPSGGF